MPPSLMPGRVLVVDDEESIREIISSMLSAAGYETEQASSGMEALAVLNAQGEFELMLSDLMMAELDGIALLERAGLDEGVIHRQARSRNDQLSDTF